MLRQLHVRAPSLMTKRLRFVARQRELVFVCFSFLTVEGVERGDIPEATKINVAF